MTKKDVVEMVSKLLSFASDKPEVKIELAEAIIPVEAAMEQEIKTREGVVITTMAPKFDIGVEVLVDGKPAPDADHYIEDGSVVTTVDGKITKIKAIETPEVEIEAEMRPKEDAMGMKPKENTQSYSDERLSKIEEKFNKLLEATIILTEAFNKLPVSEKILVNPTGATGEEFGKKTLSKKEKNLKEMYSVLEEIKDEQKKNNK